MNASKKNQWISQGPVQWLLLFYALFVVYGSLVPLNFVDRPLNETLRAFQNIPFLVLGVDSRADWIANGVLYVPLGFLAACFLRGRLPQWPRAFLFAAAGAVLMGLAVAVEFAQLYFPPRTVSQNDILAECVGVVIGLTLAARHATWFDDLLESLLGNPQRLKTIALDTYALAYVAFALFPYDVLLSWPEMNAKLDSSNWGWFLAGDAGMMRQGLQLLVEVVLTVPVGVLWARVAGSPRRNIAAAVAVGALFGVFLELAQLMMASGVSQGLSVLSRILGVCGGLALSAYSLRFDASQIASVLRRFVLPIGVAYIVAMLEVNGWFKLDAHGWPGAVAQWQQLVVMPFYYHYYTTEAKALFSLASVAFSYVPVGVLAWAYARSARFALISASLLALCFEMSKLFLDGTHPDLTNIMLAGLASGASISLIRQLLKSPRALPSVGLTVVNVAPEPPPARVMSIWLFCGLTFTCFWLATFPVFTVFVAMAVALAAGLVWYRPVWVFAIIPAALPVFDLAPWSGRFFLDEFDVLLMVCLAVAYVRVPPVSPPLLKSDVWGTLVTTMVALSFAISTLLGSMPLAWPDLNAFNSYFSPYNALRISKGVVWAFLSLGLFKRLTAAGVDVHRPFGWGLTLGLVMTVMVVFWERVAFSGLSNFTDGYRVTGPFSATHTGGAYLDCFIAAAMPFLVVLITERRHPLVRGGGLLLLMAGAYALMVTFSRAGYLSLAAAMLTMGLLWVWRAQRTKLKLILASCSAGAVLLVALPILGSEFAQSRFASTQADLAFRQAHWDNAMSLRDPDWTTQLFGMGVGSFPQTNYWRGNQEIKVGTYRLVNEGGNTYLRLDAGDLIGVEQFVTLVPGQQYVLKVKARSSQSGARLSVPICEKWLLTSAHCVWSNFDWDKVEPGVWQQLEARITVAEFFSEPWYAPRPVKLGLTYTGSKSTIDIDEVSLVSGDNADLLRNGDFSQGMDHWFFSVSGALHSHWRVHSLFYGVLFDQGWFGLVAMGLLVMLALVRALRNAAGGDRMAVASLAALVGFLVGAVFDTQIDAPRILLLMLLLAFLACYRSATAVNYIKS